MTCDFRWSEPTVGSLPKELSRYLLLACVSVLLTAGCSRPSKSSLGVVVTHEIAPQPVRVGPAAVTLNLADAAAKPIIGAHVTLEADMSHPGMAPVFADAKEVAPGRHQAQLEFGMAGDWVILVHVTLPGGKGVTETFDVRGVRPN